LFETLIVLIYTTAVLMGSMRVFVLPAHAALRQDTSFKSVDVAVRCWWRGR